MPADVVGESVIPHPAAPSAIGRKAVEGSVWMIGATGAAKALGFACQLALAWFLTKKDYGIFAIAISLSVFLSVLRDGGLQFVLEQKRQEFDRFAGPAFWMMLAINGATGLFVALVARPAARFYGMPELGGVMLLFAASVPLTVLPTILGARLAVDLKFRQLGMIQVISAMMRNLLLLVFAAAGFGARSFILPLLIASVTDSCLLWMASRYAPWRMPPNFRLWPELFEAGRWVLLGTFAIGIGNNGAYFLLGKLLTSEQVGTYFFAYQIVVQLGVLLADNVYQVLTPSFARMGNDVRRIRAAAMRALTVVVVTGAVASLSIAALYAPLERILWHGKWSGAAGSIYVLAAVWPAAASVSVLRALQMAAGHFRQWGALTLIGASVSIIGAVTGAYLGASPVAAAAGFGIGALFGAALNAAYALPRVGIGAAAALRSAVTPWLILTAAAAAAHAAGVLLRDSWLALGVTAICFAAFGYCALRLFARDSFLLVESSLRQLVGTRRAARA